MRNHMNNTLIESLVFRKAEQRDYSQIVMMHNENLHTTLTAEEKASGGFFICSFEGTRFSDDE